MILKFIGVIIVETKTIIIMEKLTNKESSKQDSFFMPKKSSKEFEFFWPGNEQTYEADNITEALKLFMDEHGNETPSKLFISAKRPPIHKLFENINTTP